MNTDTLHILAVDDEADIQDFYEVQFRKAIRAGQYAFYFAHDGREALKMLDMHPEISVVLADINMPGMNGLKFLEHVNEQSFLDQQYQFVKVIMVTAYGDMDNIRSAMSAGAFDFLLKPAEKPQIEAVLKKALQEVHKLRELSRRYKTEYERRIAAEKRIADISANLDRQLGGASLVL